MEPQHITFDPDILQHVEKTYRSRLSEDAGDTTARTYLAWCLFMQALHEAGKENALMTLLPHDLPCAPVRLKSDVQQILKECLHQAFTVKQLSRRPQDRLEAETLETLIRLAGEGETVAEAEGETGRILSDLMHAILTG